MASFNIETLSADPVIKASLQVLSSTIAFDTVSRKGVNGYVFFGNHRILRRRMAVKYYYWGGEKEFHAEPQMLASIKSPHVIEIYNAEILDHNWALFVTPFCEGGDIDDLLRRGPIPQLKAVDLLVQVLTGLNALHSALLVHRDLKPENILLDGQMNALIGDFGSVKKLRDPTSDAPGSGHSILYRPPESFEQSRYGQRGDIYQCGILLYQLLGGYLPYDELSWLNPKQIAIYESLRDELERTHFVDKILRAHIVGGKLFRFDSLNPWVPTGLVNVIRKASNLDRQKRFPTTTSFIAKLHDVRSRVLDWCIEDGVPVARSSVGMRRILNDSTCGLFFVQKPRGKAWQRDNTLPPASLKQQAIALNKKLAP